MGEWFQNGWFTALEKLEPIDENDGGYLGVMRINNCEFEYWIGMFFATDTEVPEGYEYVDIDEFDVATFWVYGNENSGELYGMDVHNRCLALLSEHNMKRKEDYWCIERYNCPRFTEPDDKGNVILDYCLSVE